MVLLLAAPAIAEMTITCEQGEAGECIVSYGNAPADPNRPRAFALNVALSGDAVIVDEPVADANADYYIYPGSIDINNGNVEGWGTPVASGGTDSNSMIIEMGSLYHASDTKHSGAPGASGELFRFTVSADTTVTITEEATRGKVVKENGNHPALSDPVTTCEITVGGCGDCPYDIYVDGWLTIDDVISFMVILNGCDGGECEITGETPPEEACLDAYVDGWLTIDDVISIMVILNGCDGGECECPVGG